ncbi:MAG: ABC transporter ATP-binding protein [Spirochaetales bacterium]|nr:ABC transporter ATP-binding protein [Spirochaetales bacterium]
MSEYLKLEGLTKVFPDKNTGSIKAVDDFSLAVERGEFVTLLGPSGCGKTTILRMLAGFETPTGGKISLRGKDITGMPPSERSMTMVFQSYALFPHLNIYDNIAYGLKIQKKSQDIIRNEVAMACQTVNLVGLEKRFPGQLSGGQQQRVALARALVVKPEIILFDEPLSNLDLKLRARTRMEIKRVQNMLGITVIYVTHDQSEALSMSDRLVVMNRGKAIQCGTPEEVYCRPDNIFTADFLGNANFIGASVEEVDEHRVTVRVQNKHIVIRDLAGDFTEGEDVHLAIRPESVEISSEPSDFTGTVDVSSFLGAETEYRIEFDGSFIKVNQSNRNEPARLYRTGEKVYLKFAKDQFRIYKT